MVGFILRGWGRIAFGAFRLQTVYPAVVCSLERGLVMRVSILRRGGAALTAALTLGFALATVAHAQGGQAVSVPMSVTEDREPGLTGSTTLTPLGGGMWRVDITIAGLPPNDPGRAAHIHTAAGARCDTGAPVTYPLTNVAVDGSGRGTSTTTITVTSDKPVQANNAYVNVHTTAQGGPGVICGDITVNIGAAAPAGGAGQPAGQKPAGAVATPAPQRPAGPAAAPQAQRPAGVVAAPQAQRPVAAAPAPVALPRTGTGGLQAEHTSAWSIAGLALIALLLTGSATLAVARRRQ